MSASSNQPSQTLSCAAFFGAAATFGVIGTIFFVCVNELHKPGYIENQSAAIAAKLAR